MGPCGYGGWVVQGPCLSAQCRAFGPPVSCSRCYAGPPAGCPCPDRAEQVGRAVGGCLWG
eukprot:7350393-Prorocentrum_lima.AAC.1